MDGDLYFTFSIYSVLRKRILASYQNTFYQFVLHEEQITLHANRVMRQLDDFETMAYH
jgi:hypothetical protein